MVSITSQGQISIPAAMRRSLNLDKTRKAWIRRVDEGLLLEPVPNLFDLAGSLNKYAIKGKSIDEIMKLEKLAVQKAIVERYKRKLARERGSRLTI